MKRKQPLYEFVRVIKTGCTLSWRSSPRCMILRILCKIINPINTLILSFLGKKIIDNISYNNKEVLYTIIILLIMLTGIRIINCMINAFAEYAQEMHNISIERKLSLDLLEQAISLDIEIYDNPEYHDKLNMAKYNLNSVFNITWNFITAISSVISLCGSFIILAQTNIIYGVLILITSIPSALTNKRYIKIFYNLNKSQIQMERKKNYLFYVGTSREYAQDIRFFQIDSFIKEKYLKLDDHVYKSKKDIIKNKNFNLILANILPEIIFAIITIDITKNILFHKGTVGDYSLYTGVISQVWGSVMMLISAFARIYDDKLRVESIEQFFSLQPSIQDNGVEELVEVSSIRFNNVTFIYPGSEQLILDNLNLELLGGKKYLLVGINGSGKTTLIKLLLRFYEVTKGTIEINGRDIRAYSLKSLRKAFMVYFQNMMNYSFTLRDNVVLSDINKTINDGEIIRLLIACGCEDILKMAHQGLNSYISRLFETTGVELSGGQSQKIALTRTFYRDAPIVILDEPSSALDPLAEKELFEMFEQFWENKLVLFTSHQMRHVAFADEIIVLEHGRVIEKGDKEDLMNQKGRFAQMNWKL